MWTCLSAPPVAFHAQMLAEIHPDSQMLSSTICLLSAFLTELFDAIMHNILSRTSSHCRVLLLLDGQCVDSTCVKAAWEALTAPMGTQLGKQGASEVTKAIRKMQSPAWKSTNKWGSAYDDNAPLVETLLVIRNYRYRQLVSASPPPAFTSDQLAIFKKAASASHEALRVREWGETLRDTTNLSYDMAPFLTHINPLSYLFCSFLSLR